MYTPNPINTRDVIVPVELTLLSEYLAENTHEVWAEGRVKEGWTYGEKRDDAAKKHPCLIPFGYKITTPEKYE